MHACVFMGGDFPFSGEKREEKAESINIVECQPFVPSIVGD